MLAGLPIAHRVKAKPCVRSRAPTSRVAWGFFETLRRILAKAKVQSDVAEPLTDASAYRVIFWLSPGASSPSGASPSGASPTREAPARLTWTMVVVLCSPMAVLGLPRIVSRALDDLACAVRDRFGVRVSEIVLFGSYARGGAGEDSDVDVSWWSMR